MAYSVFEWLDKAIVQQESRDSRASRIPAVWPSEASAELVTIGVSPIVGACARKVFFRMTGEAISDQVDAVGAWRWVLGRKIEEHAGVLAKEAGIFAAAGVKGLAKDIYLPYELDLVTVDPRSATETSDGKLKAYIDECKSFYGYNATKEIISEHKPKLENLMQTILYLNEVRTGKRLKELIRESLENQKTKPHIRNRIEILEQVVDQISDDPIGARILYFARDSGERAEFDIGLERDFDGLTYPTVNGHIWKVFSLESIYERFRIVQAFWFNARRTAFERLAERGILKPETLKLVLNPGDETDEAQYSAEEVQRHNEYLDKLAQEVRGLPASFLPPAEYEFSYSAPKIEQLFSQGLIGKIKYQDWKKKKAGKTRIGDWQCAYCSYRKKCVPLQNPNFAVSMFDISDFVLADE